MESYNAVIMELRAPTRALRFRAIRQLSVIDDPRATKALLQILQDPLADAEMRDETTKALSKRKDISAIETLISALNDPTTQGRKDIALALGRIGNPAAVETLVAHLKDKDLDLELYGEGEQIDWHNFFGGNAAYLALEYIGKPAIPKLVNYLLSSNTIDAIYLEVIEVLGDIGDHQAANILEQIAQKAPSLYQNESLGALVKISAQKSIDKIKGRPIT